MRTATSKEAELLAYEKLSDLSVIMGAVRTLYKRHTSLVWEVLAGIGWALFVLRFFGII